MQMQHNAINAWWTCMWHAHFTCMCACATCMCKNYMQCMHVCSFFSLVIHKRNFVSVQLLSAPPQYSWTTEAILTPWHWSQPRFLGQGINDKDLHNVTCSGVNVQLQQETKVGRENHGTKIYACVYVCACAHIMCVHNMCAILIIIIVFFFFYVLHSIPFWRRNNFNILLLLLCPPFHPLSKEKQL